MRSTYLMPPFTEDPRPNFELARQAELTDHAGFAGHPFHLPVVRYSRSLAPSRSWGPVLPREETVRGAHFAVASAVEYVRDLLTLRFLLPLGPTLGQRYEGTGVSGYPTAYRAAVAAVRPAWRPKKVPSASEMPLT